MTADPRAAVDMTGTASDDALPSLFPAMPRWVMVVQGTITALLGLALLVWPEITIGIAIFILVAQLIIAAVVELFQAFASGVSGGLRFVFAVSGTLSLLLALLLLRHPYQTVTVMTVLVGVWLVVHGILEVFRAMSDDAVFRVWSALVGLVSLAAGAFVVVKPDISLKLFVGVTGVWMLVAGVLIAAGPFFGGRRADGRG